MHSLMKALVKLRLAEGWHAWIGPDRRTVWARMADGRGLDLQTVEPLDGELDVLDEVLREKVS